MKHIEILNSILEIYIAKLKLETAVIYSTDLKRTGHLFHLSLTLSRLGHDLTYSRNSKISC